MPPSVSAWCFRSNALAFLERDVPDFHALLVPQLESWPMQRIVHRDERVDIDGNGFSAIGRLELNQFLDDAVPRRGRERRSTTNSIDSLAQVKDCDLLVGADGANSFVRRALGSGIPTRNRVAYQPLRLVRHAQPFDCLSLTFRANPDGHFVAHHYRHSRTMSTFVVECDEATWRRAGLDRMSEDASRAYCERVFAPDLNGHSLVSNKSIWRQFPLLVTNRWAVGNAVLFGDAQRTVHFSIGSGTRLAFEDAIALDRAFAEAGDDVPLALAAFERERRPIVEKIVAAANASSYWYERIAEKMTVGTLAARLRLHDPQRPHDRRAAARAVAEIHGADRSRARRRPAAELVAWFIRAAGAESTAALTRFDFLLQAKPS